MKKPDVTILTALPFERSAAQRLLASPRSFTLTTLRGEKLRAHCGQICGLRCAVLQIGLRGRRLPAVARFAVARPRLALLSFGLAGGLVPGLKAAAVISPRAVLWGGKTFVPTPSVHRALCRAGAHAVPLVVTGTDIVATPQAKATLAAKTAAQAVDMESGVVGSWATGQGIPWAVVRAISDPAGSSLPPAVFTKGESLGHVLCSLPALAVLAVRVLLAEKRLRKCLRSALAFLTEATPGPDTTWRSP